MIEYIKGRLVEKNPTDVVVESASGVAYMINVSLCTSSKIKDTESIKLYIHTVIREDAHQLFGFFTREEREIFRKLIAVSGVGAGTARTILSSMDPQDVIRAVSGGDVSSFKNVKGIGLKTAQRIILDLKGKLDFGMGDAELPGLNPYEATAALRTEALDALEILGFVRKNCERYVDEILQKFPATTVENLIKMTLKAM
ncbi:MAG: Holliday junction branch migration protein RuvA [Flavobacteriales bacterium]|nr:Holliday junction branch migration protein RuvA [Flavobacteriales bacterium]